ncbi:MAG: hypothetical protein NXI32_22160 [bacterium]|nr:hypothetical protein [bacterium]
MQNIAEMVGGPLDGKRLDVPNLADKLEFESQNATYRYRRRFNGARLFDF